jgi:hypothetical protein
VSLAFKRENRALLARPRNFDDFAFGINVALLLQGELVSYDFFVLSDSTDPAKAVEEGTVWADLCRLHRRKAGDEN